jgi:hypothetical protein
VSLEGGHFKERRDVSVSSVSEDSSGSKASCSRID